MTIINSSEYQRYSDQKSQDYFKKLTRRWVVRVVGGSGYVLIVRPFGVYAVHCRTVPPASLQFCSVKRENSFRVPFQKPKINGLKKNTAYAFSEPKKEHSERRRMDCARINSKRAEDKTVPAGVSFGEGVLSEVSSCPLRSTKPRCPVSFCFSYRKRKFTQGRFDEKREKAVNRMNKSCERETARIDQHSDELKFIEGYDHDWMHYQKHFMVLFWYELGEVEKGFVLFQNTLWSGKRKRSSFGFFPSIRCKIPPIYPFLSRLLVWIQLKTAFEVILRGT